MKQRVKHRKDTSKSLRHYQVVYHYTPPYYVLLDDSCLRDCASCGLINPKSALGLLLGSEHVIPCTHEIILNALRTKPDKDELDQKALQIGQQLFYVPVFREDGKHKIKTNQIPSVLECCKLWVQGCRSTPGANNMTHCVVGTGSFSVRAAVRQRPDVPTIRVDLRSGLFTLDSPTQNSVEGAAQGRHHTAYRNLLIERDKEVVRDVLGINTNPHAIKDQQNEGAEGDAPEGEQQVVVKHKRKPKPKGPNPLASRPRKTKLTLDDAENMLQRAQKPKRERQNDEHETNPSDDKKRERKRRRICQETPVSKEIFG
eukprot:PhF_6_TR22703/c0_g1_i1/m.32333/K14773/UTP23; U3 small nucleolar RNA-associated protein 23